MKSFGKRENAKRAQLEECAADLGVGLTHGDREPNHPRQHVAYASGLWDAVIEGDLLDDDSHVLSYQLRQSRYRSLGTTHAIAGIVPHSDFKQDSSN